MIVFWKTFISSSIKTDKSRQITFKVYHVLSWISIRGEDGQLLHLRPEALNQHASHDIQTWRDLCKLNKATSRRQVTTSDLQIEEKGPGDWRLSKTIEMVWHSRQLSLPANMWAGPIFRRWDTEQTRTLNQVEEWGAWAYRPQPRSLFAVEYGFIGGARVSFYWARWWRWDLGRVRLRFRPANYSTSLG